MNIIPAVLGRTIDEVVDQTKRLVGATGVIHLDVMDGQFVHELTPLDLGPLIDDRFAYDLHLMVTDPSLFMPILHRSQIRRAFVHAELSEHSLHQFFELASDVPVRAGLALNPTTPMNIIDQYRGQIDSILLMAVTPGASGKTFDENTVDRVHRIHSEYNEFKLFVDGGLNEQTVQKIKYAEGCVMHSAIFGHTETPAQRIDMLQGLVKF